MRPAGSPRCAPARLALLALIALLAGACFPDASKVRAFSQLPPGTGGGSGSGGGGDARNDGTGGDGAGGIGGNTGGMGGNTGGRGGSGGTGGTGGGRPPDGGNPDTSMQTRAEACNAYAEATVATLGRCSSLLLQQLYGTPETALRRVKLLCRYLELPGVNFPKRPVAPCVAAIGAIRCDDFFDNRTPAACFAVGDYADGSRCSAGDQCQSQFCAAPTTGGGCGTCAALPGLQEDCTQNRLCKTGLLCSVNATCATPGELEQGCGDSNPCRGTLTCDVDDTCQPKGGPASVCFSRADCDEAGGAFCNTNIFECASVRVGTTCGASGDGKSITICPASGTCTGGVCGAAAADGATCDDTNGPFCMPPATCFGGTCQLPPYNATCVRTASDRCSGGDARAFAAPASVLRQLMRAGVPGAGNPPPLPALRPARALQRSGGRR